MVGRTPVGAEAAAVAAAKAKVGPAAVALLTAADELAQRAATLLAAPVALRESARHQTTILYAEAGQVRLRTTPISTLQVR